MQLQFNCINICLFSIKLPNLVKICLRPQSKSPYTSTWVPKKFLHLEEVNRTYAQDFILCMTPTQADKGSHSFTCYPHVFMSHTYLYSPATDHQCTLAATHFSSTEGRRLSWPRWLVTYQADLPVLKRRVPLLIQPFNDHRATKQHHRSGNKL